MVNNASSEGRGAFRVRSGTQADLPYCVELLPAGFRVQVAVRERLVDLWAGLLASEARAFAVVEDLERVFPENIEGFGLSVFVNDRFVEEIRAKPRPQVAALLYERLLEGKQVVLTARELAASNATTGINILSLHFGLRNHDLTDPRTVQALTAGSAGFLFFHGGYRIKAILNEVFGMQAVQYMQAGGFQLVHDFQKTSPATFAEAPPDHYPYFFMLLREWVEPGAVNPLSQLFHPQQARILFSATERRVLERAMLNQSDGSIADDLGMSSNAVKKVWRSIFDRVGRRAPYVIPRGERSFPTGRGQEKRRHLLDYLRTHLEEIRPASIERNGRNQTTLPR